MALVGVSNGSRIRLVVASIPAGVGLAAVLQVYACFEYCVVFVEIISFVR